MKLASSLLVTGIIACSLWGVALLQPMPARAISSAQHTPTDKTPSETSAVPGAITESTQREKPLVALNTLVISGTTAVMPTSQVQQLWQDFKADTSLNRKLTKQPKAVYVFYRDFSANFEQSTITIGYSVDTLSSVNQSVTLSAARYERLLPRKKYSNQDIARAWQNIDYRRPINRVIEIHHLSEHSAIVSSELLIEYGD
ncbi:hypothetical protein [Pseudoalteromonas sp. McH1-42]|uniref:hypothetical protein n=1 Tax=Pseudoalteromonas sp. McH1-42 TaxID=2917752 RepID=UPI001EF49EC9|nr:hypothetical protein [Pseudoalteromonas sp. McH1-42]MCG7561095.1 hypothetical protein [Pseudoalteromonas sp. McH1-42]